MDFVREGLLRPAVLSPIAMACFAGTPALRSLEIFVDAIFLRVFLDAPLRGFNNGIAETLEISACKLLNYN